MVLQEVELVLNDVSIPDQARQILTASDSGVTQFFENHDKQSSGFVPSDSEAVFRALRATAECKFLSGRSFCEWGSGYGTATCLASTLGFEAFGIEIERQLVEASRRLAREFQLTALFAQGTFVPANGKSLAEEAFSDNDGRYPWLQNQADNAYQKLGRELQSFDVVFSYPWPGEEYFIAQLFDEEAANGALLLSYSDSAQITLQRKTAVV